MAEQARFDVVCRKGLRGGWPSFWSRCAPALARAQQHPHVVARVSNPPWKEFTREGYAPVSRPKSQIYQKGIMAFSLPDLPYDYGTLEPYIDTQTMQIHHDKHHATYVNNLNAATDKFPELKDLGIVDLNKAIGTSKIPGDVATAVRNNGGGHLNHSFFWQILTNPSNTAGPSGELKGAIDSAFGSLDELKSKFNAAAAGRFGSGWAWVVIKSDGKLAVTSTPNQDNPLFSGAETPGVPILGLDVWEHAYYLKYQNRRPEYISAFWNVVNWETVDTYFAAGKKGSFAIEPSKL